MKGRIMLWLSVSAAGTAENPAGGMCTVSVAHVWQALLVVAALTIMLPIGNVCIAARVYGCLLVYS